MGFAGCILKEEVPRDLVPAIHSVMKGITWFSQTLAKNFQQKESEALTPSLSSLTHREAEVLKLMAEGLSNKEIANKLRIKEKTVEFHVSNILKKWQVSSRTGAVMQAKEKNIL